MVSHRCILYVSTLLDKMGINYLMVKLGYFETSDIILPNSLALFNTQLKSVGLSLLDNKKLIMIEKIKNMIIDMIHIKEEWPLERFSTVLSRRMGYSYTFVSNSFTSLCGMTIQHFIILQRIEKVKELLLYNELNLTQISYRLQYTSIAHLSRQFKQITGCTPTQFKLMSSVDRYNIDNM
jgi:AraC-like DNA-binding protein